VRQTIAAEDWEILPEADANPADSGTDDDEDTALDGELETQPTEEEADGDLVDYEGDGDGAMEPPDNWDEDPHNPDPLSCGALLVLNGYTYARLEELNSGMENLFSE